MEHLHIPIYIRFGEIPIDEKSKVFYNGEYIIKEEDGVSVFDCEFIDGRLRIILPIITTSSALYCIEGFVSGYLNGSLNKPIYIVTGDLVGYGSDNEPLIRNVEIIMKLSPDELFDVSHYFDYDDIGEEELPSDKVYYVKINDVSWCKCSKSFYERFEGKKVVSGEALAFPDVKVEELYRVGQRRSIGVKIENICSCFGKLGANKRSLSIFYTKTIVRFLFYIVGGALCKPAPPTELMF